MNATELQVIQIQWRLLFGYEKERFYNRRMLQWSFSFFCDSLIHIYLLIHVWWFCFPFFYWRSYGCLFAYGLLLLRISKTVPCVITNSKHTERHRLSRVLMTSVWNSLVAEKMSASNGGVRSEEEKNFFNSVQLPFPEVIDGKINTLQFLESSKGVVALVGEWQTVILIIIEFVWDFVCAGWQIVYIILSVVHFDECMNNSKLNLCRFKRISPHLEPHALFIWCVCNSLWKLRKKIYVHIIWLDNVDQVPQESCKQRFANHFQMYTWCLVWDVKNCFQWSEYITGEIWGA